MKNSYPTPLTRYVRKVVPAAGKLPRRSVRAAGITASAGSAVPASVLPYQEERLVRPSAAPTSPSNSGWACCGGDLIQDIGSGNADGFMKQLQTLFANIPYDMRGKEEHDYQTVIYVIFMMLHIFIDGEHRTGEGRIDLMLCAGDWIYVIELKLNKTAEAAMQQIHDKNYPLKFRNRGKKIMLIGANLDSEKGQLTDWIKEEYHD